MRTPAAETFAPIPPQECALAQTIDLIGDKWTLLLLRAALYGVRRFDQIHQDTGMPRTVLSRRLGDLVRHNILDKVPYREPGKRARFEYALTPRGRQLMTAFVALMEWGEQARRERGRPRLRLYDTGSGERVHVRFVTESGQIVDSLDRVRARIAREQPTR